MPLGFTYVLEKGLEQGRSSNSFRAIFTPAQTDDTVDGINPALPLRTRHYGTYVMFLITDSAGFTSSTVGLLAAGVEGTLWE